MENTEDEKKTMLLPWGSEQICNWCKTFPNCSFIKSNKADIHLAGVYPFPVTPQQMMMVAQMSKCPVSNERIWNEEKLENQFGKYGKSIWKER